MAKLLPSTPRRALLAALVVATVAAGVGAVNPSIGRAEVRPRVAVAPRTLERMLVAARALERAPATLRTFEPALVTAAATPPTPPPPPTPVPPLPRPAGLPGRWNRVALTEIGRISIPKIAVDHVVREGVEQMVIDSGPAHWPGTAAFGSWGNVVLAGHRSTHTEPFRRAAELVPGDEVVVSDLSGMYTYRVTGIEVVASTALWIVQQQPGRTLTIFTCHPIGSSAQRLVVHAELVSTPRPGQ